ncbi:MAG: ribosome biogenesis GTPase YlqF [Clostridia bacterium]|nr:ribosome biogenesis GTPase YlqF [Clostridia bacterium]
MRIQWYPGHMAKTRREIEESLALVDLVAEVVDARVPISSRNPDLWQLCSRRPWIVVLNRVDQADPAATAAWRAYFESQGHTVVETDAKSGKGCSRFLPAVREKLKEKLARYEEKGQSGRAVRIMILGVPNVGKSTFINRIAGKALLRAEDRPGVTRSRQWVRLAGGVDMLDTPGMLWPKFEDERVGINLAVTGSVRDEILDIETLAMQFLPTLLAAAPEGLLARFKMGEAQAELPGDKMLEFCARKRGFLLSGGVPDTERCAKILLDEFRGGKLGT